MAAMGRRAIAVFLTVLVLSVLAGGNAIGQMNSPTGEWFEKGDAVLHSNEVMLEEYGFSTQDIWAPKEPYKLPAPSQGMVWQDVTVDYRTRIDLADTSKVEAALGLGIPDARQGTHEYLLHGGMIEKLEKAGITAEILGGVTRFILMRDPAMPADTADESGPDEGYGIEAAGSCNNGASGLFRMNDLGYRWLGVPITCAPAGSYVTNVEYRLRIDDQGDPNNFFCGDYEISIESDMGGLLLVYDNLGLDTDGGYDDDPEDDSDIYLNWRSTSYFNGETPNQTWWVKAEDTMSSDVGQMDYFSFYVYWNSVEVDLYDDGEYYREFSPIDLCPFDSFEIHTDIRNGGTADSGAYVVRFYASTDTTITTSDYYIGEVAMSGTVAGNWDDCDWYGNFPDIPQGLYWIGWIIDADSQVSETNESNNRAYKEDDQANICDIIDNIDLYDDGEASRSFSPQTLDPGDSIQVHCDIRNGGGDSTTPALYGPVYVHYYASTNTTITPSDYYLGLVSISEISAGYSADSDWFGNIPLSVPPGDYWIGWIIDPNNTIPETNESNNTAYKEGYQLTVLGMHYDSHVIDDDSSGQSNGDGDGIPECGEAIEVWVSVSNNGGMTATNVNGTLSTSDPYVTITDGNVPFPDIPVGGLVMASDDFDMVLAGSIPDGHDITFNLTVTADQGVWFLQFPITTSCVPPTYSLGVLRDSYWFLDVNGSDSWDVGDERFRFGTVGDIPAVGDWNGDGTDVVCVFRNGTWYLDTNGSRRWEIGDQSFAFGTTGDTPAVGDWNGDGTDVAGVFRNGTWYLDANGNHQWDIGDQSFAFGTTGDKPVVGDWNGDGFDEIGVFRNGMWYLDANGNHQWDPGIDSVFRFGTTGDKPVVGDW